MLLKLPIISILCPVDFSFTGTAANLLHRITQMIHNNTQLNTQQSQQYLNMTYILYCTVTQLSRQKTTVQLVIYLDSCTEATNNPCIQGHNLYPQGISHTA